MSFLLNQCTFQVYNEDVISNCNKFDCSNEDLNEFFCEDALNYSNQLLGKSYCFTLDEDPTIIVCAFTISNDSIKTTHLTGGVKKKVNKTIPRVKTSNSYPAVLIGRLGVNAEYRNIEGEEKTGKQLMDFIKSWFIDENNKTGCRHIVVDSYNSPQPIKYYQNNGFIFLFNTEAQEKEYTKREDLPELKTRLMFFDLILLK